MQHSTNRELFHYWNALRSDRPAPLRPEFEPSAIGNIIGSIFMLEVTCTIAAIRLAGGNICGMFGEELRGKAFAKLWLNGVDRKPSTIANRCIEDTTPYLLRADGLTRAGSISELELLIVPLTGTGNQSDRVVGSLADLDQNDPFVKKHIIGMSLTSIRAIDRDTIPVTFDNGQRANPAKMRKTITKPQKTGRKKHHLHVIDGGINT
ncbi:PAS domain-containing protein [Lentilitoribacter sp. EG35]|uniref:PAS domain-containing protein n=1 Tax=Lentilitoribacter sp. EG35 TaxID=3234192 RepID=UPI00345F6DBE